MKKLILHSFLIFFVFTNTELHQLLKLPVLVHHYLEHHENVDFLSFLNEHYQLNGNRSDSNPEHDKLPFKSYDCGISQISMVCHTPSGITFKISVPQNAKENFNYFEEFYSSDCSNSIWQPPKFC